MRTLLNKIKNLRKSTQHEVVMAKIASLEEQLANLEQANVIILTKLLQIGSVAKAPNNKREDKSEIIGVTPKGLNAGKTPTIH